MSINSRRHTFEVHGMIARRGACQWKRRCVFESLCLCCAFRLALCVLQGLVSSIPPSLLRFCVRFILSPHILVSSESATFPSQTGEFQHRNLSTVDSRLCFDSESTMGCCASKQANELSQRTEERRQQTLASTSDTFMNNVHPLCGTDNESVDLAGALALLRSNILEPFGSAHSDNRVDAKDFLKKLKTVLTSGALHDRGCPLLVVHLEVHRRQAQRRGCGGHVEEEFWRTPGFRQPRVVDCGVLFQQVQGVVRRCGL